MGINNEAAQVEFTGRVDAAAISNTAAVNSAKLQAISMIVSRIGAKHAQDIEKGLESTDQGQRYWSTSSGALLPYPCLGLVCCVHVGNDYRIAIKQGGKYFDAHPMGSR